MSSASIEGYFLSPSLCTSTNQRYISIISCFTRAKHDMQMCLERVVLQARISFSWSKDTQHWQVLFSFVCLHEGRYLSYQTIETMNGEMLLQTRLPRKNDEKWHRRLKTYSSRMPFDCWICWGIVDGKIGFQKYWSRGKQISTFLMDTRVLFVSSENQCRQKWNSQKDVMIPEETRYDNREKSRLLKSLT